MRHQDTPAMELGSKLSKVMQQGVKSVTDNLAQSAAEKSDPMLNKVLIFGAGALVLVGVLAFLAGRKH